MVDDLKLFQTVTGINLGSNQPSAEQLYWVKPKHELVLLAKTITAKLHHQYHNKNLDRILKINAH